jgi:hypothetical protein
MTTSSELARRSGSDSGNPWNTLTVPEQQQPHAQDQSSIVVLANRLCFVEIHEHWWPALMCFSLEEFQSHNKLDQRAKTAFSVQLMQRHLRTMVQRQQPP